MINKMQLNGYHIFNFSGSVLNMTSTGITKAQSECRLIEYNDSTSGIQHMFF